jgi:prevent-host-death family protein
MSKAPQGIKDAALEVGIRELREHLSRYIAQVSDGRSIVVTDRGKPVARLIGVDQIPPSLQRMIDEGLVRMPTQPATPAASWKPVKAHGSVSELLLEQRRGR